DFAVVAPGTQVKVHVLSTGQEVVGKVSRRAPAADEATRTVHFEIDVPNADRSIPVGTTGEISIDVGQPTPAVEVPLLAAAVRGTKATVFVIENGIAHARALPMLGERGGKVYLDAALKAGSLVVTEGRALLNEGDKVSAELERAPASRESGASAEPVAAPSGATAAEKAP
ncbi:MAG TPA: hypothetical protein VF395_07585, partial [Polyangiaceae bacterium]